MQAEENLAMKLRVLLVDDDQEQLDLFGRVLRRQGFIVETSDSPFGTTNLVRSFEPDVVLLDLEMPAIRGDQLVSVIRDRLGPNKTKILLFSATDEDELREHCADVDADGYLPKTTDGPVLRLRILELTKR